MMTYSPEQSRGAGAGPLSSFSAEPLEGTDKNHGLDGAGRREDIEDEGECDHEADVACSEELDVIAERGCVVGLGRYLAGGEGGSSSTAQEGASTAQETSSTTQKILSATQEAPSTTQAGNASETLWAWRGLHGRPRRRARKGNILHISVASGHTRLFNALSQLPTTNLFTPDDGFLQHQHLGWGDEWGKTTSLHIAARYGREEILEHLLSKAEGFWKDVMGRSPLHYAYDHPRVQKMLLRAGYTTDWPDGHGWTPLHFTAHFGSLDGARTLVEHGADAGISHRTNVTALHVAAEQGHTDVARLLLDSGADVDAKKNSYLKTPLHNAAFAGHTDVARLLLERGADARAANVAQFTPLHAAASYGHVSVLRLLLDRGVDIEARNRYEHTSLACAANCGKEATGRLLLDHGADAGALQAVGEPPRHPRVWEALVEYAKTQSAGEGVGCE